MQSGISPQRAVIGSSTIGTTGQPDIRPSDSGRDEARPFSEGIICICVYVNCDHFEFVSFKDVSSC